MILFCRASDDKRRVQKICIPSQLGACAPFRSALRRVVAFSGAACNFWSTSVPTAMSLPPLPPAGKNKLFSATAPGAGGDINSAVAGKAKGPLSRHSWTRMQSTTRSRDRCGFTETDFSQGDWEVPLNYDFCKSTSENYRAAERLHVGPYHQVRSTRDHSYHGAYTRERQLFQGESRRGRPRPRPRPPRLVRFVLAWLVTGRVAPKHDYGTRSPREITAPRRPPEANLISLPGMQVKTSRVLPKKPPVTPSWARVPGC